MRNPMQRYLLESVFRSPDDAAAAPAPASGETAAPPVAGDAAAAAAATPAVAAATDASKTESAPSLLATADAGKRDGAPTPAADAKPGDVPPPGGADAKPDAKAADKPADAKAAEPAAEPAKKPDDGKTGDAKAEGAESAADKDAAGKTAEGEQPPAPPVYEAWKAPEGVVLDQSKTGEFNSLLGQLESAKGDHAKTQEVGQKLIDLYVADVKRLGDQLARHQVDVWNRHIERQIGELKADPQFGGNRIETSLGNAKYVVEAMWGLSADEAGSLIQAMDAAGISSNRLLIKALNKHYERYREPEPVPSLDPAASTLIKSTPGNRNWYDKVDGVTPARS
jgi:hypothetical protein